MARFLLFVLLVCVAVGCAKKQTQKSIPGVPLVFFGFNEQIKNEGLLDVFLWGNDNRVFSEGVRGQSLAFGVAASNPHPLLITFPDQYNPADYNGLTLLTWIKQRPAISDTCVVLADGHASSGMFRGWRLIEQPNQTWCWELSDGKKLWRYKWTNSIADTKDGWFQWGFSYSRPNKEACLFKNGQKVAIIGLERLDSLYFSGVLEVGGSMQSHNFAQNRFVGSIDELSFWGRPLPDDDVSALYHHEGNIRKRSDKAKREFTLMSINCAALRWRSYLWAAAAGDIERVNADVLVLQDAEGFGGFLYEKIGGACYVREQGLMVISRFPLGDTFRSVRDRNAAFVWVMPSPKFKMAVGSCKLDPLPSITDLLKPLGVDVYTFIDEEEKKRGTEMRLLLCNLPNPLKYDPQSAICFGIGLQSGSHLDWTERNKATHNGIAVDFPVSKLLETEGFIDAYREYYPDETLFQGFTTKAGKSDKFDNRQNFVYYKGVGIKLLESKIFAFVPDTLPDAQLAVWTQFAIEN